MVILSPTLLSFCSLTWGRSCFHPATALALPEVPRARFRVVVELECQRAWGCTTSQGWSFLSIQQNYGASFLAGPLVLRGILSKLLFSAWSFQHALEGAAALLASPAAANLGSEPVHQLPQTLALCSSTHFVRTPACRGAVFVPGWLLVTCFGIILRMGGCKTKHIDFIIQNLHR